MTRLKQGMKLQKQEQTYNSTINHRFYIESKVRLICRIHRDSENKNTETQRVSLMTDARMVACCEER